MNEQIYAGTAQYNLIYIFAIHDAAHDGYLKIGLTSFSSASSFKQLPPNCDELKYNAHNRIRQYTKTALIEYDLLHVEIARKQVMLGDGTIESTTFNDRDVHEVLDRSGYDVHKFYDTDKDSEWYKVDLPIAIASIKAVKEGRNTLTSAEKGGTFQTNLSQCSYEPFQVTTRPIITLRDEQKACISKTKRVFSTGERMLWDCKMRFGKTITAYSLIKEMKYQKVLVVTHRPAVVDGWRSDFHLIFDVEDRVFLTKANVKEADRFTAEDANIDTENDRILKNVLLSGKSFVYFASMQDLRGSKLASGKFEKNRGVFAMDWDLIIFDEAHEGTQTDQGLNVQQLLEAVKDDGKKPKKVLQLSGTPYNLLTHYDDDNVYSWDYVMEQRRKNEWDEQHPGDYNPYADLPEMRICTFDLRNKMPTSYRYEDESIAFNFREFFRTWTGDHQRDYRPISAGASVGDFVYEDDVWTFLDLITTDREDTNFPFASPEYRDMFRHTFWILPGVKEARAFSTLLKKHDVFRQYEIVNVAGEGDIEQPYDDALKAVRNAIKEYDYTITLSCGKLTTGVTVKEWTGVMLLSGSSSTAAAGYMQTIFRVQSAGSIDGKQKKICYAFDFAPDRALKVLSEVHQLKKSAVGTDDEGRIQLGEFLNFCPVLAEGETGMEFYDVPKMMRQLKKLNVDAAVKSGFDDDSIYKADAGIVMDKQRIQLMELLKARLNPQKKEKKQTSITVNEQGLTDEQYKRAQDAKRKLKRERTPEEIEALAKESEMKKKQQGLFDLLRNISIRLPLLIYGTATNFDEYINLTEFINIVDDASWTEFMPKEVDKVLFIKLLVFYDEDVIEGAGMRIRRLAKAADELPPTHRVMRIAEIFSYFKNPAKETVLTPWRVVNMHMGKTIGGYNFYGDNYPIKDGVLESPRLIDQGDITTDLFLNENVRILEMNSKSGLYPLYVAYSLYRMLLPKDEQELTLEETQSVWDAVLNKHLFVLCQTKMAVSITKRTLVGYRSVDVNAIFLTKILERMQDLKRFTNKITNPITWEKEGARMRFDAVVGNPPYQLVNEGEGYGADPIYHLFIDAARSVCGKGTFIHPGRFLFNAGKTPKEWNQKILNDEHFRVVEYWPDSTLIFPGVDVKGGIAISYWDSDKDFGKIGAFVNPIEMRPIMKKVLVEGFRSISELVYPRDLYRLTDELYIENPWAEERPSKGHRYDVGSNVFETFPELFTDELPKDGDDYAQIFGRHRVERQLKWIKRKFLKLPDNFEYFKVFVAKANGSGEFGETLSSPVVGLKNVGHTVTFLSVGKFDTQKEAENVQKYIMTKFARAMLGTLKATQDNPREAWLNVPLQNFTNKSDIDWDKTIPEIDKQLYNKYCLTGEEINFIENNVKPMNGNPSLPAGTVFKPS